jgi:hypothetical protein
MKDIKVLGIDLAKNIFQLHGTDNKGTSQIDARTQHRFMASVAFSHQSGQYPLYRIN